jgi:hypothetical protein
LEVASLGFGAGLVRRKIAVGSFVGDAESENCESGKRLGWGRRVGRRIASRMSTAVRMINSSAVFPKFPEFINKIGIRM